MYTYDDIVLFSTKFVLYIWYSQGSKVYVSVKNLNAQEYSIVVLVRI